MHQKIISCSLGVKPAAVNRKSSVRAGAREPAIIKAPFGAYFLGGLAPLFLFLQRPRRCISAFITS